jgi:hypothetical protein
VLLNDLLQPENYRYERKFFIPSISSSQVEAIIKNHPSLFHEAFPSRRINNIYLDTLDMTNYWDNVDGVSKRVKVRTRWYGDLFGEISKPVLEFKIKNNTVGAKVNFPLSPFILCDLVKLQTLRERFSLLNISGNLKSYLLSLNLSLMNSYCRKYYVSADTKFRVTIDSGLQFFKLTPDSILHFQPVETPEITILELKYNQRHDDLGESVSSYLPFRLTKSSKYVSGLNLFF